MVFAEAVVFCHRRGSMLSSGSRSRRFPRWEGPDTGVGVVTCIRAGGVIADIRAPRRPGVDAHPVIVPKVSRMRARVSEAQSEPGSASRPTAPAITTGAMPANEPSASWRVVHACKRWSVAIAMRLANQVEVVMPWAMTSAVNAMIRGSSWMSSGEAIQGAAWGWIAGA